MCWVYQNAVFRLRSIQPVTVETNALHICYCAGEGNMLITDSLFLMYCLLWTSHEHGKLFYGLEQIGLTKSRRLVSSLSEPSLVDKCQPPMSPSMVLINWSDKVEAVSKLLE